MNNSERKEVILVDTSDLEIGRMEKLEAHQKGLLHRAFSVFVFNRSNQLLLQRRAMGKYHSEDLWTNTCCSHPEPGESITDAAKRRLMEEMGFTCELHTSFSFIYHVALDNGLEEHELDHIVFGISDETPVLNPVEASDYTWKTLDEIRIEMAEFPEKYTSWFKIILNEHFEQLSDALKLIV